MRPPSNIVVKKHVLLVISVISCMFTTMGWYLGTTNWLWKTWQSWLVLVASLLSTPIAVTASVKMSPIFLLIYAIIGTFEIALKIVFIVTVYWKKKGVATECTKTYKVPDMCIDWRLDDLNLTNSAVFHIVSSIAHLFLIMFSIQLFFYTRMITRMKRKVVGIDNLSFTYSASSVSSIAFHSSHPGVSRHQSKLITHSDSSGRRTGDTATYGTFRRICNRFRILASNSV